MQYKFRGKRVDNDEWVYGSHCMDEDGSEYIFTMWKKVKSCGCCDACDCSYTSIGTGSPLSLVHPDSVGMWTGLKDRNEYIYIYDDDFCLIRVDFSAVDADKSDYRELKVRIFYDDEMFAWCWHWKEIGGYGNSTCTFSEHEFDVLKVIGNTTDNPELLE